MKTICEIVEEALNKLKENKENSYIVLNENPLIEMSRINTKEFYGLFPHNKFNIRIWSNDHNPPHFHVIADGWNIAVSIESGEILRIEQFNKKDSTTYSYVEKHIKEWLDSQCCLNKHLTNRENARLIWEENHE